MHVLGITGPIGCGKSTVAAMVGELGALEVIDADAEVRELMGSGTPISAAVGAAFGPRALLKDGAVDREKLASIVFADRTALQRLEAITHPAVRERISEKLAAHADTPGVVVIEAILLLQSPLAELCKDVWIVTCAAETQAARLRDSRGYSDEDSARRIAAAPSFDTSRSSTIIVNNGSVAALRSKVEDAWRNFSPEG